MLVITIERVDADHIEVVEFIFIEPVHTLLDQRNYLTTLTNIVTNDRLIIAQQYLFVNEWSFVLNNSLQLLLLK